MVLPLHDTNPTRRVPVVTYVLIAVNVIAFLISPMARNLLSDGSQTSQCRTAAFLQQWAAVPDELIHGELPEVVPTDEPIGANSCLGEAPDYDKKPVLSVLTAMFLHGGWFHLLGNLLFLYVFGNNVEDRLGRVRFLLFYLACGYAATYGFALFDSSSETPLLGASGAIAGVLGAYLVLFPRAKVWSVVTFLFFLPIRLPAWLVLVSWFVLQLMYSAGTGVTSGGGVAYAAHVIGFVIGALLGWPFRGGESRRQRLRV